MEATIIHAVSPLSNVGAGAGGGVVVASWPHRTAGINRNRNGISFLADFIFSNLISEFVLIRILQEEYLRVKKAEKRVKKS
ncbi:hypothetical protein LEP1GSC061_3335 [Leptospira wolffii serovar Khorat str. Khorat-H2]|nr:hypothetical protein LEP1GSC061_3335 [Leptospira wolffii serovar Khorat str. Khorat-H2]